MYMIEEDTFQFALWSHTTDIIKNSHAHLTEQFHGVALIRKVLWKRFTGKAQKLEFLMIHHKW
jgi:hypothetical protein